MPSSSQVPGTLSKDAKVYGTKENATPEAGYHEKQKDKMSPGYREKGSGHLSSRK
jgi:hypothetical protein